MSCTDSCTGHELSVVFLTPCTTFSCISDGKMFRACTTFFVVFVFSRAKPKPNQVVLVPKPNHPSTTLTTCYNTVVFSHVHFALEICEMSSTRHHEMQCLQVVSRFSVRLCCTIKLLFFSLCYYSLIKPICVQFGRPAIQRYRISISPNQYTGV